MSRPRAGSNKALTPALPPSAGRPGGGGGGGGWGGGGGTRCGEKVKHPIYAGGKGNVFSWVPDVCMLQCVFVKRWTGKCGCMTSKLQVVYGKVT